MTTPTLNSIQNQWTNAVKPLQELRKFAALHTAVGSHINVGDNYLNMENTLVTSLDGDFAAEKIAAMQGFRARLNAAMSACTAVIAPHVLEYGKFIKAPETDLQVLYTRIWDYMIANSLYVSSRNITYGAPTPAVGNTGNGEIIRLNVDESGFFIENQSASPGSAYIGLNKYCECTSDKNSGAYQGNESFLFYGQAADRDDLRINGIRGSSIINGITAVDTQAFIANPSFESTSGTDGVAFTGATQLTGWTMSAFANFMPVISDTYRSYSRITTPRSLRFLGNGSVTQALDRSNAQARLPLYVHVAFKPETACDGNLTLTFGSKTGTSFPLGGLSGWHTLRLALDTSSWLKNWNINSPTVALTLSGRTTGTLLVDDVIISPFIPFDGGWYAVVGGSIPFLKQDKFAWLDSTPAGSEGILQHWSYRAFGRYLPHQPGSSITWTDPG
jgi:hypothetical protein